MGKVYGYTRVSHQDSANTGLSMKAQKQAIIQWFKMMRAQDKALEWGGMHRDLVVSAFTKNLIARPGGIKLNMKLQPGDHVVFAKLDRGFRNTMDCLRTIALWQSRGVTVHFIDLHLNSNTAMGKMMLTILAALAEWESARKSERVREALAIKKLNREKTGGPVPKGFQAMPRQSTGVIKVVINRRFRAMCLWSWLLRKQGLTIRQIGDRIEDVMSRREGRKFIHVARDSEREWRESHINSGIMMWNDWIEAKALDPNAPWPKWRRNRNGGTLVKGMDPSMLRYGNATKVRQRLERQYSE